MSLSGAQSRLFLGPLGGRTTAFLLKDRPSNIRFARVVLGFLVGDRQGCRILDLDAFYSSNLDAIAVGLAPEGLASFDITIPEPGSEVEATMTSLFRSGGDKPLLIDSINSLYQLLSLRNPRSATRKFSFMVSALSHWAGSNGKAVIASVYDRRPTTQRRASRSLADAFDCSVSVSAESSGLSFRCERGGLWRGRFFLPFEDG